MHFDAFVTDAAQAQLYVFVTDVAGHPPVRPDSAEGSSADCFLLTAWNLDGLLLTAVGVMPSE